MTLSHFVAGPEIGASDFPHSPSAGVIMSLSRHALRFALRHAPLLAVWGLLACSKPDAEPAADPAGATAAAVSAEPSVVTIVARDYAYEAPDTITAGMVTLKLVNQGPELHHVQLFRFTGGKTYADLVAGMQTMKPTDPLPPWIEVLAGPNTPVPGGESTIMQELPAGEYAIVCLIPSPDRMPHFAKGMMQPLTVLPASTPVAAAPVADITVQMTDYGWDVQPAITAGKHVLRVENLAEQEHEMVLVRLEPGKTPLQVAEWAENPVGPPPGTPLGGTSGQRRGTSVFVPVDLTPGEYALLCFIPDAKDGKPHYVHGMLKQFTVS
jgi:hypothetical protein